MFLIFTYEISRWEETASMVCIESAVHRDTESGVCSVHRDSEQYAIFVCALGLNSTCSNLRKKV